MLIDLKRRLDEPEIRELLASAMYADAERIDDTLERYKTDEQIRVWGYESDGDVIGVIGYKPVSENELEIVNIAVSPDERGHGYGRGIILEMIEKVRPLVVFAETDEEAVDFYRNIGFTVESLGEKYPGVERFKCTFETDF